ncbi:hypothetical protein SAMN05421678_13122 [Actinopolymorpha cephalotaxi]|uniref:D-isomer specific 2-hydroxyacid dehydrogenase, catalytic domain n=1 Tax=Actinopolymorpha cephalotaxi TaxID=504797 RepID=A0A1I3CBD7_9ACTN|nr:hypothetical protein [Actinopolymorpha cephalotaxi]NYH86721.1 hypothetical protein [Actinopolymorpha cephalotaxi]SFH71860.1 hypothetical protein SAMN05421678_13122 [Actinopolymorpha cephalotaxi]
MSHIERDVHQRHEKPAVIAVMGEAVWHEQFDAERVERLARTYEPVCVPSLESREVRTRLDDVDVLLTSWGATRIDAATLSRMPLLRAVLHVPDRHAGPCAMRCGNAASLSPPAPT